MLLIIKRKLYSKNLSSKSKSILVIKRFSQNHKFYSNRSTKQTMRIKRFSMMNEEERLYANPFAAIGRINALRRSNNAAYKGLNFFQAASKYRSRGKVASIARDLHKSTVTPFVSKANGILDTRRLQGGNLFGLNTGQSNLVGLQAGVKQAATNVNNGGFFSNLFKKNNTIKADIMKTATPITAQHKMKSENLVKSLQNAGMTDVNIGNLASPTNGKAPFFDISKINPSTNQSPYITDNPLLNKARESAGLKPLIDTNSSSNINNSKKYRIARTTVNESGNLKVETSSNKQSQPKPSSTPTTNKEVKIETPSNTGTNTPVETFKKSEFNSIINNTNTPPVITTNQQTSENQTTTTSNKKADDKFKLGWKGKLALGAATGLGAATYGGAKLVGNMLKDDDE